MRHLLPLLTLLLAVPASAAQPLSASMQALQQMADGCPPETCFDGAPILRREGPLAVLTETKVRHNPGRHFRGGKEGGGDYVRPSTTYKQKVGIADRDAYVKQEKKSGKLLGGILGGVLGFIGLLAGPLVLVTVGAGILAGSMIGGAKAESSAKAKPKVFERFVTVED